MKLISFDIGLRNLAFCVIEGTNRSNLKITHWDLIDVMAETAGHDSPKCFKCKKPANWLKNSEEVYTQACQACSQKEKRQKRVYMLYLSKKSLAESMPGMLEGREEALANIYISNI